MSVHNHSAISVLWGLFIAVFFCAPCCRAADADEAAGPQQVSYSRQIRPILVKKCFHCHGMDENAREADLRLDVFDSAISELPSGATAIVPGRPESSALIQRVRAEDDSERMPPSESEQTLSELEKQLLEQWIAGGAQYERHWSYQPVKSSGTLRLPASMGEKLRDWSRGPIDDFILGAQVAHGLQPAQEASRRQLIRRVYFNLVGLPPTPDEVQAFVDDKSSNAYERLVDRLLARPAYGERWARHWLDLARYSDTVGYEGDPEIYFAWRYRDYVIDALNDDKPYDLFIIEQLAGDEMFDMLGAAELPVPEPERAVAGTFLRLAPFTEPRGDLTRHEMLSEMTTTVGTVLLGMTVGCAQCHDHKYDEIPTKDFYRMKAFFATVALPQPVRGDIYQIGESLDADFYRHGEKQWVADTTKRLEQELEVIKGPDDKKSDDDDADDDDADDDDPIKNGRRYALEGMLRRLQPKAYSLTHSVGPPYGSGVPTSYVFVRGVYDNRGDVVEPGFPSALTGHQKPAKIRLDPYKRYPTRGRRLALAKWIASPENPLTSRVMVNRLWQHHFGRGIVATPSDFGQLGQPPTHPKLLDWLARDFVDRGWSIKSMHRAMVLSGTYRQTSLRNDPAAADADPANNLLWRFRRRRLEGETIRDSVLAMSGRLHQEVGGLPVFPSLPDDLATRQVVMGKARWWASEGPEGRKRSIYVFQRRSMNMPLFDAFDALVANSPCARRRTSVTPLQSLSLYNGPLVNDEIAHFAERVRQEGGAKSGDQIGRAFLLAMGREPTSDELIESEKFLQATDADAKGLACLCRVLLNANEFVYVD